MAALDARHVHETGGAADERAAGEREFRHRLQAAFGQRAGAIGEPPAALESRADRRVGLEPLEFLKWSKIGILVMEVDDKADRNKPVVEVIDKRAAARAVVERPAERMLYQPRAMLPRHDLPELLQPDAEFLRLAPLRQPEAREQEL